MVAVVLMGIVQVQFNRKTEKAWSDLIPHLKAISTETGMNLSAAFPAGGPTAATAAVGAPRYGNPFDAPPPPPDQATSYSTHRTDGGSGSNFREEDEEEDLVGV